MDLFPGECWSSEKTRWKETPCCSICILIINCIIAPDLDTKQLHSFPLLLPLVSHISSLYAAWKINKEGNKSTFGELSESKQKLWKSLIFIKNTEIWSEYFFQQLNFFLWVWSCATWNNIFLFLSCFFFFLRFACQVSSENVTPEK